LEEHPVGDGAHVAAGVVGDVEQPGQQDLALGAPEVDAAFDGATAGRGFAQGPGGALGAGDGAGLAERRPGCPPPRAGGRDGVGGVEDPDLSDSAAPDERGGEQVGLDGGQDGGAVPVEDAGDRGGGLAGTGRADQCDSAPVTLPAYPRPRAVAPWGGPRWPRAIVRGARRQTVRTRGCGSGQGSGRGGTRIGLARPRRAGGGARSPPASSGGRARTCNNRLQRLGGLVHVVHCRLLSCVVSVYRSAQCCLVLGRKLQIGT
jgi:hypothetical protein